MAAADPSPKANAGANSEPASGLEVNVLYTGRATTRKAFRKALRLAAGLHARIRVIVPRIVPYPAPLDEPPVSEAFERRQLRFLSRAATVETHIEICYCRDEREALACVLAPCSLVVLGGVRHWWPTAEQRIARTLRKLGHQVVFVDTGAKHA